MRFSKEIFARSFNLISISVFLRDQFKTVMMYNNIHKKETLFSPINLNLSCEESSGHNAPMKTFDVKTSRTIFWHSAVMEENRVTCYCNAKMLELLHGKIHRFFSLRFIIEQRFLVQGFVLWRRQMKLKGMTIQEHDTKVQIYIGTFFQFLK